MQKNHDGMDGKNTMPAYRLSDEEYARILEFKRDLHMHPELSRQEYATTEKIRSFLQTLPDFRILPVKTGTEVWPRRFAHPPGTKVQREVPVWKV